MCSTCSGLQKRSTSLLLRINNTREWNKLAHEIRGAAYRNLLSSIEHHWKQTHHFVDTLDVMNALGRRAIDALE